MEAGMENHDNTLFDESKSFASFSVKDVDEARTFYHETLGIEVVDEEMGVISLDMGEDEKVMLYPKENHEPASYTVLNFPVDNLERVMSELSDRGVTFEHYPGTDEKGVYHGDGPLMAWFKDPSGNILSVLQE
jgi:catechol 2,3-dioxygenase-like lactoylglutathione lyase family enzyme